MNDQLPAKLQFFFFFFFLINFFFWIWNILNFDFTQLHPGCSNRPHITVSDAGNTKNHSKRLVSQYCRNSNSFLSNSFGFQSCLRFSRKIESRRRSRRNRLNSCRRLRNRFHDHLRLRYRFLLRRRKRVNLQSCSCNKSSEEGLFKIWYA